MAAAPYGPNVPASGPGGLGAALSLLHGGERVLVAHAGSAAVAAGPRGSSVTGSAAQAAQLVLSPGGEAGTVHVGGALVAHGATTLASGGLLVLSNMSAPATTPQGQGQGQGRRLSTAASADPDHWRRLFSVDDSAREIKLGGPSAAKIELHGDVSIDATWPDGRAANFSVTSLDVTGSADVGSGAEDLVQLRGQVTAHSNFTVVDNQPGFSRFRVGPRAWFEARRARPRSWVVL